MLAIGVGWSLTDFARPGLALAAGILLAILVGNPAPQGVARRSKSLLKLSVVGLGFGVPLSLLQLSGPKGFVVTSIAVAATVILGLLLVPALRVQQEPGWLITIGTAICGGSAIAALGSAIKARGESLAIALGSVFLLNAAALWLFPPIGAALALTQTQFGVWASIAIHDTASVVGAAAEMGEGALETATILKLLRTLWILPLVLIASQMRPATATEQKAAWTQAIPWFIFLFLAAAIAAAAFPTWTHVFEALAAWSRRLLTTTLFLIGASLSWKNIRAVGPRPLVLAVGLWVLVSLGSLVAVLLAF
jgi:uncharacterized integral membrane protein (TIGR00698 family)